MDLQPETVVQCPYCGEPVTLLLDLSAGDQEYVEDCQVCCQPMLVAVSTDGAGDYRADARRESD
ncbi:MAG: CPXCG motif-containing cysteine-rich protein [Xanthomonadales bacterium]|nr:CPXCG motif-containing cysteine-rich protein [Gammaproteobacteria bacterium]NNJ79910.1 CPXCG motif-containing cysteine-rich protein [Xanthomonadales bacterium]MBT8049570.1 CPXCG motif-containing cysteine-rich protein [Gammaproteobacteria bacterium]MBT8056538.1 CPXCG motif-containing cysteine-rich protein [Gammaproteobacteria bacterium]NNK38605.1 CPXCG motif-containing cysteine-rich protein [Xanthomonadales bacterium]